MALVVGTNCGFVTAAPDADPSEAGVPVNQGDNIAGKFTSPAGNNIVTELGWWQGGTDHDAGAYNAGIYNDSAGIPGSLITPQSSGQVTTEDEAAWYKYTGLSIPVLPSTVYWFGWGFDAIVAGAHWFDANLVGGTGAYRFKDTDDEVLLDPWQDDDGTTFLIGFYALYEALPYVPQAYMIMKGM